MFAVAQALIKTKKDKSNEGSINTRERCLKKHQVPLPE